MPPTAHISQDQRSLLAGLLQARLDGLTQDAQGPSQAERARQTLLQDADDASQRSGEHEVEGIVSDIDSQEFKAVTEALQRVHRAGYGLCIDCQVHIPFERLQLEPQALRCVACQALHERQSPPQHP